MGRVKKVEIKESLAELLSLSKKQKEPLAQARLRAYYLYKSEQCKDYISIAQPPGYERPTIGRWFADYRKQGLLQSLKVNKGGRTKVSKVNARIWTALAATLSHRSTCFTSYQQVQQWLQEQDKVKLSYSSVHARVHYQLHESITTSKLR